VVRVYWWRGHPNFGDVLARILVEELTDQQVSWAPPEQADLVVVGSIASHLPPRWTGTILGIGAARPGYLDASTARVLALRGHMTQGQVNTDPHGPAIALGDPALLVPMIVDRPARRSGRVVVPHWQDHLLHLKHPEARVVHVEDDPLTVVSQIAAAEEVVTSSLHGIVVADAFGIPRCWQPHRETQGGGFKFRDYATVVGEFDPDEWILADQDLVASAQDALMGAFALL